MLIPDMLHPFNLILCEKHVAGFTEEHSYPYFVSAVSLRKFKETSLVNKILESLMNLVENY